MKTIVLALLLSFIHSVAHAQEPDAPLRVVVPVHDGVIRPAPGVEPIEIHGGAYLDAATVIALAADLEGLKAENEALKAAPVATPTMVALAVILGVVVGGGAVLYVSERR